MPIRPENRDRYPKEWPLIRSQILQRAGDRCEWEGCGVANHAVGYWSGPRFVQICTKGDFASLDVDAADSADGEKVIEIVLTVAHLDHVPEHCDPSNLRAWCQRHHLAYDLPHHLKTAYMTRRAARRTLEMFP